VDFDRSCFVSFAAKIVGQLFSGRRNPRRKAGSHRQAGKHRSNKSALVKQGEIVKQIKTFLWYKNEQRIAITVVEKNSLMF
jgi:hypothetical protein